ncbi:MAG: ABC transporter permease [Gemmatimonadota bacterium]
MSGPRKRRFRLPPDPERLRQEVDEEVRFHLEKKVERLRDEGLTEEEAWAEARRRFGSVDRVKSQLTREGTMGMRRLAVWDGMRQDMRYALRQVFRNPMFSAITVLTLALGIGATTAIFSVVDGILFRPLPFPEPHELTAVWADWSRRGGPSDEWMNFPNYFDLKDRSRTLEAVAAWDGGPVTLTDRGEPEQIVAGFVSHDMLSDVLGISPAMGRGFTAADDEPGAPGTVLLTDGFWRRALGGEPSLSGTTLTLDGEIYTVIGILPPEFEAPFMPNADVWVPLRQSRTDNFCGRGGACLHVVARRADSASLEEARAEATEIARQLEVEYPEANTNTGLTLLPLLQDMVKDARAALLVLLGGVGVVLLIACVNVANLLLARSTVRSSELAVRSALGAGRRRLTSQLLTESALLAALGGLAGLALAYLGTDVLVATAPAGTPRIEGVGVDGRVLAFVAAATLLSGLLFGVIPSLRSAAGDLHGNLREGGRGGSRGLAGMRARGALVSGQVALALMLLVGAGLLLRSFQNLRAEDLGFEPENVLTLQVGLPGTRYPDADARRSFVASLEERLGALPGVDAVGSTSWLPLTGFGSDVTFNIEGRPVAPPGQEQAVWFRRVTPGYPDAMGMRLVAGRWLTASDDENAPRVVVINDGLARRHFPGENPVGQRLNLGDPENPRWWEIVGIATEVRYFGIRGDSRDALYLPFHQAPTSTVFVVLRSGREAAALASETRTIVAEMDPSLAVASVRPLETVVADALGPERFVTLLLGLFAAVALVLAVVGLYGVVSYGVSQRMREMGVRLALGAESGRIRGLILGQSLILVGVGLALGVGGGLAATRLMERLLFGVSATDPWTFGVVAAVLTAVALVATAVPARRAARVDPIVVLRSE